MNKKEWLSRAYLLNREIEKKEKRLERLKASVGAVPSVKEGVGSSNTPHSPFESSLLYMIDLENDVKEKKEELKRARNEIGSAIHRIGSDAVEEVLELRYLCFKEWVDIARELDYCLSNVYKLHQRGLESVKVDPNN